MPSVSKTQTATPTPAATVLAPAAPQPTQEDAFALRNSDPQPQAQAAQRGLNAQVQPKTQPQTVYSLMPADFLHDDLTGSEAPALQRLLNRWGFSEEGTHSWQAADSYSLSLYQRWAGLKPTGSVDAATRESLLGTWQKYADSAIPRQRLPLEGRYIGLNPGHQNRNYDRAITPDNEERFWDVSVGTRGRVTGLYEYELNLTVALKVRDALQAQGARVLLSRTSNDVRVGNSSRTRELNREQVDAVLLIHADGNANPNLHGLHMIVSTRVLRQKGDVYERSHALARALQDASIAATGAADKGVGERDNLRILLSGCTMPAALIEMGYMTNPAEDRLLATDAYQNKIVDGLVQGFLDYFSK
jgi:N-acetylmuramoyl-L-alanine amidase